MEANDIIKLMNEGLKSNVKSILISDKKILIEFKGDDDVRVQKIYQFNGAEDSAHNFGSDTSSVDNSSHVSDNDTDSSVMQVDEKILSEDELSELMLSNPFEYEKYIEKMVGLDD
jgi:hypothetical protein